MSPTASVRPSGSAGTSRQPSHWSPAARPAAAPARRRCLARPAAAAGEGGDAEVAVFRFTLGNDELDALVPRVVGGLGAAALAVNHLLGDASPSEAQLRAEALGAGLAAVAFATPAIEQRLKELAPGRGRQAAAAAVDGAASVFALQPGLPDATKQELAWASYALLRNANTCGLAAFWDGRAVLARGLLGAAALGSSSSGGSSGGGKGKGGGGSSEAAAAALEALGAAQPAAASAAWRQGALYCPDRAAIAKAGVDAWPCVPAGAESLLVQPLLPFGGGGGGGGGGSGAAPRGVLLLLSERPRALSPKERAWAAAIAAKLYDALAA